MPNSSAGVEVPSDARKSFIDTVERRFCGEQGWKVQRPDDHTVRIQVNNPLATVDIRAYDDGTVEMFVGADIQAYGRRPEAEQLPLVWRGGDYSVEGNGQAHVLPTIRTLLVTYATTVQDLRAMSNQEWARRR